MLLGVASSFHSAIVTCDSRAARLPTGFCGPNSLRREGQRIMVFPRASGIANGNSVSIIEVDHEVL